MTRKTAAEEVPSAFRFVAFFAPCRLIMPSRLVLTSQTPSLLLLTDAWQKFDVFSQNRSGWRRRLLLRRLNYAIPKDGDVRSFAVKRDAAYAEDGACGLERVDTGPVLSPSMGKKCMIHAKKTLEINHSAPFPLPFY